MYMDEENNQRREMALYFDKQLSIACSEPGCFAPKGALCDTPSLWIHLARFKDAENLERQESVTLFAATARPEHDDDGYWFVPRDEETVATWAEENPHMNFFMVKLTTDI